MYLIILKTYNLNLRYKCNKIVKDKDEISFTCNLQHIQRKQ